MAKKIVLGLLCSVLLTLSIWRLIYLLALAPQIDDILFIGSPLLAIIISSLLVRSTYKVSDQTDEA